MVEGGRRRGGPVHRELDHQLEGPAYRAAPLSSRTWSRIRGSPGDWGHPWQATAGREPSRRRERGTALCGAGTAGNLEVKRHA
jgi:hypothetical protein